MIPSSLADRLIPISVNRKLKMTVRGEPKRVRVTRRQVVYLAGALMHRSTLVWVVILGVIATMFFRLPLMVAKQDSVLNTYGALVEVDALARQRYVEAIHDDRLVDGAIDGMLRRLDPYSGYISAEELPSFERRNSGHYVGVGVFVGVRNDQLTVIAPVEGSPAADAGIRPGDRIVSIDGLDMEKRSVHDAERLLVGEPGTMVRMQVQRPGDTDPITVQLTRAHVTVSSVHGCGRTAEGAEDYVIDADGPIAYIRVSSFRRNTMVDFDRALQVIARAGAASLVLDLRFDPGGIMQQAIAMVDRFVDRGTVLSTVTRLQAVEVFPASAETTRTHIPIVVLINDGSASAAEIVAGSLQAHGRATVVGERSFGKGSVQHLLYLTEHKAAVKLTVAHYRLPNGRIIHRTDANLDTPDWGIIPDVVVELSEEERRQILDRRERVDLSFVPVEGAGGAGVQAAATRPDEAERKVDTQPPVRHISVDRQLAEAVRILKKVHDRVPTPAIEAVSTGAARVPPPAVTLPRAGS